MAQLLKGVTLVVLFHVVNRRTTTATQSLNLLMPTTNTSRTRRFKTPHTKSKTHAKQKKREDRTTHESATAIYFLQQHRLSFVVPPTEKRPNKSNKEKAKGSVILIPWQQNMGRGGGGTHASRTQPTA